MGLFSQSVGISGFKVPCMKKHQLKGENYMQRPIAAILLTVLLSLTGLNVMADIYRSDTKESLRGLNGFFVNSQFIDVQPEGLTTNGIETMVKATLHDAGIPVDAEPKKAHDEANLSITVSTIRDEQLGLYLFTVEVAVTQDVRLVRQSHSPPIAAQTWSGSIQGLTTPDRTDVIEQALKQCVNKFVVSDQAVNPQQQPSIPK